MIHEEKSKEQLLSELRDSYALINQLKKEKKEFISSLPVIVFETDDKGNITLINRQFELELGYTMEDISNGFTIEMAVAGDDVKSALEHYRELLSGKEMSPFEGRLVTKGGNILSVIVYPKAVVRNGKITGTRGFIVNQTHQKQAEQSYRVLFESSIDGIAHADLQGRIQKANKSYLTMTGYTEEELTSITYQQLTPVRWHDMEAGIVDSQIKMRGYSDEYEKEYIRKDGTVFPISIRAWLIRDDQGNPTGMWAIVRDITDRKLMEQSLKDSEERYRRVFENDIMAVCLFDLETFHFIDMNEAHIRLYGYSREELMNGLSVFELTAEHGLSEESVRHIITEGKTLFIPLRYHKKKDGTIFPVEIVAGPCILNNKQVMIAIVRDISDRLQMEEELRKSKDRLDLALKATKDAVWDQDLVSGSMYYSKSWWGMLGYQPNELGTQPDLWRGLMHPEDLARTDLIAADNASTYDNFEIEVRLMHKDGHYIPILTRGGILRDNNKKPVRIYGTNTDLTERKKVEEERKRWEYQRQQVQKAESLSRMAGAVAHHFNNLLGAVIGNLDLVSEDVPEDMGINEMLNDANQAAHKAAELSSLMLTYLGQSSAIQVPVDLTNVCLCSLPTLNEVIKKNVFLKTDLESKNAIIDANVTQIKQVLKNLVTNASESIGNTPGTIQLAVRTTPSSEIQDACCYPIDWMPQEFCYVCLEIKDSGSGIANSDIEKIFDPFFSSKFTGRGLGLPVVLGIVRAHNGGITVESELSQGSIFSVYFPLSSQSLPAKPDKISRFREIQWSGTVLLVDDDDQLRKMSMKMLKHIGFSVLSVSNGKEAVEVFRQNREEIRFVLCDLTMPHMNGWETMAALRQLSSDIPMIMASGYDEAHVMENHKPEEVQGFLHKPYNMMDLKAAIGKALEPTSR